jgi:uncharacterized membrane protein
MKEAQAKTREMLRKMHISSFKKKKKNTTKKKEKKKMKTYSIIRKNTGGQLRGNRVQLNCNLTKSQADSEIKEMAEIHASEIEMPEAEVAEFVALAVKNGGFHDDDVSYYFIEEE